MEEEEAAVVVGHDSELDDAIDEAEALRRRLLAAEVYRPPVAKLIIMGEAPPPERFFYFGNSIFFRYLRRAFINVLPQVGKYDADWFLAFYRELGGWRTDVCDVPQRATRGGADDIGGCVEKFMQRWKREPKDPEALLIISPKRLVARLPDEIRQMVFTSVPPPGQWNAHREAFLREMERILRHQIGVGVLQAAAQMIDAEEAALEFELVRACADGTDAKEIERLMTGHPREADLHRVWQNVPVEEEGADVL